MFSFRSTAAVAVLAALFAHTPGIEAQERVDTLTATLSGEVVVGGGDEDGMGVANLRFEPEMDRLCYDLQVMNISEATATHIHRAPPEADGPPALTLAAPKGGESSDCIDVNGALVDQILAEPTAFYINVHNPDFPGGAIRGQIGRS